MLKRCCRFLLVLLFPGLLSPAWSETLIVGNKSAASATLIDLDSGKPVAVVTTGEGPHEVAVSKDGKLAVVTNYGTAQRPGNSLTVIEVEAGRTVGTIDLGEHTRPHGIVFLPDARRALVTTEGSGKLLLVDIYLGEIERVIPTGQRVSHMVAYDPSGRRAYVANIGSGSVSLVDVEHGELLAFEASGHGAEGIALAPNGRDLWVTNRGEDTLSLFDARYLRLLEKLEVPGFPIRAEAMPGGERILVTSARSATLSLVDPLVPEVAQTVSLQTGIERAADTLLGAAFGDSSIPIGIEIAPGGDRVWIAHAAIDRVQELDTGTWQQTRLMETGREPDAMGYSPLSVDAAD